MPDLLTTTVLAETLNQPTLNLLDSNSAGVSYWLKYLNTLLDRDHHFMKLYLSYSAVDRAFALQLQEWLHSRSYGTWVDIVDINQDENPHEAAERARGNADSMIALLSPDSIRLRRTTDDWKWGLENLRRMFAIRVRPFGNIPTRFATLQYVDFTGKDYSLDEAWSKLQHELSGQRTKPSSPDGTIFISYRSFSRHVAVAVRDALHEIGLSTWMDSYDLPADKARWDQEIDIGLQGCDAVAAILTSEPEVEKDIPFYTPALCSEWQVALQRKKPICFLEHTSRSDLPEFCAKVRRINIESDFETGIKTFVSLVHDKSLLRDFQSFTFPNNP